MKRMRQKLPEEIARRELILGLADRLGRHPAVERVWLYGSRARGDNFERSDIDLAVEGAGNGGRRLAQDEVRRGR